MEKMKKVIAVAFLMVLVSVVHAQQGNDSTVYQTMPYVVDKETGGELSNLSILGNLTLEQGEQILEQSEEKKKSINLSLINFRSGYSISVNPGVEILSKDDQYYLIQFYEPFALVNEEIKKQIEESGVVFFSYISTNAFYAKIPVASFDTLELLVRGGGIRYIGSIPNEASINSQFLEKVQTNPDAGYNIVVHLFEAPSPGQLVTLKSLMQIYSISDTTHFTYGIATGGGVKGIQKLNFVKFVEEEVPAKLSNQDNNTYIVVFSEWTSENKDTILSIRGVRYIKDTSFGTQEYPAIIISADQSSLSEIRKFDFVYNVAPIIEAELDMPKADDVMPNAEYIFSKYTSSVIIGLIFLIVFLILYKRLRG